MYSRQTTAHRQNVESFEDKLNALTQTCSKGFSQTLQRVYTCSVHTCHE